VPKHFAQRAQAVANVHSPAARVDKFIVQTRKIQLQRYIQNGERYFARKLSGTGNVVDVILYFLGWKIIGK
jgi:hypothetical protein